MLRVVLCLALSFAAYPAVAFNFSSHCIALAKATPGVEFVSFGDALERDEVRLHYVAHSTYLIETAQGETIATDYTGFVGPGVLPDVVTMNRAHSSHYTDYPDPAIPHVLRGWGENGTAAEHFLELGDDLVIRNVTTDIRGGAGLRVKDGNSIFIFEVAGLCIGHLGHIHHEPSEEQYAMMGRLDIVMAPVDGGMTLDTGTMIKVLKRLRSSVILPMHWFGDGTLQYFLDGMSEEFAIERPGTSSLTMSLRDLPRSPTVVVLWPRFIDRNDR